LDDVRPAGRLAEALRLRHRPKVAQVSQFHGTSVITPRDQSDRNILRDDQRRSGILRVSDTALAR
jgi:hypothetical protein